MKSLFRILIAIASGISTYLAFPIIWTFYHRVMGRGYVSLFLEGIMLTFFAMIFVPIFVFICLRLADVNKIHMSRHAQAIILISSGFLALVTFGVMDLSNVGGWLIVWLIALILIFFFFLVVVLASLYYFSFSVVKG